MLVAWGFLLVEVFMPPLLRYSVRTMPDDDAFDFLHQQLKLLASRVERLEGKVAQLHAESMRPGLLVRLRREFEQLEKRIQELETP